MPGSHRSTLHDKGIYLVFILGRPPLPNPRHQETSIVHNPSPQSSRHCVKDHYLLSLICCERG